MAEKSELSIEDAYRHAAQHFEKKQYKPALSLLSKIVRAVPKHAHAHHLLGLIAFQNKQYEPAVKAVGQALKLQPNNAQFMINYTEVLRKAGRLEDAISVGKNAIRIDPNNPGAHSNLGLAYYDNEDLIEAEASQRRAVAMNSDFGPALNNLGSIARDNGNQTKAISFYRKAFGANPHYAEAANNLIASLIEAEELQEAETLCNNRMEVQPRDAELQRSFGRLSLLHGRLDIAEGAFRNAISLDDSKADSYVGLAQVLYEKNHPKLAELEIEKALRLDPENAMAVHQFGMIKANLGDIDGGFEAYRKALTLKPDLTASQIALGHLLMENGEFSEAKSLFEETAAHSKDPLSAQIALARLEKMTSDHPILAALEAAKPKVDDMIASKAVAFHYAIGKAYEDVKRYDDAFGHFATGAAVKRSTIDYDPQSNDQLTSDIINTFNKHFIEELNAGAASSEKPFFVVGMPRSGTTLTESILNAHPKVFGAGELNDMHALFGPQTTASNLTMATHVAGLKTDELRRKINSYIESIQRHSPTSPHIVDKMPANFQMIGLIHALLPKAKIIHIARNPFDTCLSCFTRVFERSQLHSYEQTELGRFFNNYVQLMNHWKTVLPDNAFHTVHYENLVDDIDTEARRMIAFCDLEWDDRCLEFYKGKRRVRTASVQQVRQPLYKSSKEKWRRYEKHLGPLIETIGTTKITFE